MNDLQNKLVVPFLDLKAQYNHIRDEVQTAIREVCESQQFIGGPRVSHFEQRIADYSNSRFAIGVSSGTDALLLALMALDIGRGHEVVTSAYSFFASAGVVARVGAQPVFGDIQADSFNLDPEQVAYFLRNSCQRKGDQLVNRRTRGIVKAIMPVHLFGQMADMHCFSALADEFNLYLIEDAAQAIGAESHVGIRAGSAGDIGCFSFFPSKNLGAFGDAGMCITNSEHIAEQCRILRLHGASPKYHHSVIGGNFRLDALQAAILDVKLNRLDDWTKARQENAARYDDGFSKLRAPIRTPVRKQGCRHIYNQYVIGIDDRDELKLFLQNRGIATEIYYPVPMHLQECFRDLGYREGDCPQAENAARQTLALPISPEMSHDQQDYVVNQISDFFNRYECVNV